MQAAFVRAGTLWIKMGDAERQVTTAGKVTFPIGSPDGEQIAYRIENSIWLYTIATQKNERILYARPNDEQVDNLQWAPDKKAIAFQWGHSLEVIDLRTKDSLRPRMVANGVGHFSWTPDGKAFLVSSTGQALPDGWSAPILYKIPWEAQWPSKQAKKWFMLPSELVKGSLRLPAFGTTNFKWSPDGQWIAFVVYPTASFSMDSNLLCVIKTDGTNFRPLDEMLLRPDWFKWSPQQNVLGYLAGGGRFVFATPKQLKLQAFPTIQSLHITPPHFSETAFTWHNANVITVARMPEYKWSNDPAKRPLPVLYQIQLQEHRQKQITTPPFGFGDTAPHYLRAANKLSWVRYNRHVADVWMANPDGSGATVWIKNLQTSEYPVEQNSWDSVLCYLGQQA